MKVLNLTQHTPTPDQINDGLAQNQNPSRVQELLTISEESLRASDSALDGILDQKVQNLISEFILPMQVENLLQFVTSHNPGTSWADPFSNWKGMEARILNAAWEALAVKVLVGGAPILMERLIPAIKNIGAIPVYSLTGRVVTEVTLPDGGVKKIAEFRHIRWKEAK